MIKKNSAIDWGEVVFSLVRKGVDVQTISRRIGVTRPAVIRWRDHGDPSYENGCALLELWMEYNLPRLGRHFPDKNVSLADDVM